MRPFNKAFIFEASIGTFMNKIQTCKTIQGLKELEKYYTDRCKELELNDADDISIRDALAGRREELEADNVEPEEDF